MYRIGIDIGGTKINIGILDQNNQLLTSKKLYINEIVSLPRAVLETLDELCASLGILRDQILSCGIGVPGTVSEDGRKLIKAPNIEILSENIVDEMEALLHIPTVMVQDSRAAAFGEYICGGGQGSKVVVCVTLGTGIGTGIVIDGKIFNGGLGSAGELGHLCVVEDGRPCGCGKKGCLEKYCAGGGLDITARELYGEGSTAEALFTKAKAGDKVAQEEIDKAVRILGSGMVAIINLLSPECLLFSGGLSDQEELYLNPLIRYIEDHCYSSGQLPRLQKAALGANSPLIGAALVGGTAR